MKTLLTISLFFTCVFLSGQSKDSLILFESLLDKSYELRFQGKLDSAKLYSERLQKFPLEKLSQTLRLKYTINFAKLQPDVDKAITILTDELHDQERNGNYINVAHILYTLGENYFDTFNDSEALAHFIKADSLLENLKVDESLAVMSKVGIVNVLMKSDYATDTKKFDKAALYIDEGIKLTESIDFPVGTSILLEKKGHYLQLKDRLDESLLIYRKALKVSQAINYTQRESSIYDGMGKVFFKKKNIDSAAFYFQKHLKLIEKSNHSMDIVEANYNIGQFYNQVSKFEMAENHLEKAWSIIGSLPNVRKEYPYNIQNELAIAFSGLNNPEKALASLTIAKKLQSEVYNFRNSESIRELETRYRSEKKEREIALLTTKNELAEQKQKSQRNILLAGIGLTTLAGILLFVLYRNRNRTNKKLREIDALKTNFFTNISHEFRTPLTLISVPIQESLEESGLSEEKRKHFEIAQRNIQRLSSLVDQLLELSKIASGNRTLFLENNTPTQMIAAWCESFLYLAEQKEINFITDITDKKIEAWFDRDALENIAVNLLGNAVKYTSKGGKITIEAAVLNKILTIKITNSGQGLTKSQMTTIFNRFYQTDGHNEGAGIGLSLVKELVELHKGSINVDSRPHDWTEFKVTLCLDRTKLKNAVLKEDVQTTPKASLVIPEKEPLINEAIVDNDELPILLIVEDNADVRCLLADTFKKEYKVLQAEHGDEGIAVAIEQVPDIIISDLMMPVRDGIELIRTLKGDERTSHIPIILLTAKAGDENELTGIEIGADAYITKPFNKKILKSKTAFLICLRQTLRSRYSQEVILKPQDIIISSIDERFLEKVQQVLDEKLVEPSFTVEDFSNSLHMSRMQLHRKLKALTGHSASEFVRSQRLKLAAKILRRSHINVSEVGYSVGFNDHAYFSKCFRENYNCTPSEFAAAQKAS